MRGIEMNDQEYIAFMDTTSVKRFSKFMWVAIVTIAGFPLWALIGTAVVLTVKGA